MYLELPFRASSMTELYSAVTSGVYEHQPGKGWSAELTGMLDQLLQTDPALRPSCDQILSHPKFMHLSLYTEN